MVTPLQPATPAATVIDTPNGIRCAQQLSWYFALRIEVRTGMRHSRVNIAQVIRSQLGFTQRNKAKLLQVYEKALLDAGILSPKGAN
jgi:hypothetical protein